MGPLTKRRHSTRRGGKRQVINMAVRVTLTNTCPKCANPKLQHRACPVCGFYKDTAQKSTKQLAAQT